MSSPVPHPSPHSAAPLVGRERERAVLGDALAAALAGRGSLVLIGGTAGIGKTTLSEALCAEAHAAGALVLIGRCYDLAETPPYGPWREMLGDAPRKQGLPALPTAVLPPECNGEELLGQEAIVRRLLAYFATCAAQQPLVLLLEDLHWGDLASFDLLRFVSRGLGRLPLLLLATYRGDEVADDHPLYQLLLTLVREARASRLDLRPLDAEAIGALVAARYSLSTADHGRLAGYLARRSEGNALFLGELLRTLESAGTLRQDGDRWALGDLTAVSVPPLLRQVIAGRLARLGEEDRRLLAVAAAIGQEPSFDLWAAVARADEAALLTTAERAIAARVLETTETGVRFAHALIRETTYVGVLAPRREAWHRQAGEVLAAAHNPDPDAVAYHFQQAADDRAAAWLDQAAERARRDYAWRMAADRLEAALAVQERNGAASSEQGWILVRLALFLRHVDRPRVLRILAEAAELAKRAEDARLAASARFTAGLVHCYLNDFPTGITEMVAAVAAFDALPPPDDATRARLRGWGLADDPDHHRGVLAFWFAITGRLGDAIALGEAVAARGAIPGAHWLDGAFAPDALRALGTAYALQGRPAEAQAVLERNLAAYHAAGDHSQVVTTLRQILIQVYLPYRADDLVGRRRLVTEIAAARVRAAGKNGPDYAPLAAASLHLVEGRWIEAHAAAATASGLRLGDSGGTMRPGVAAPLARWQGNLDAARAIIREVFPAGPAIVPGEIRFAEFAVLLPLAAALALDDDDQGSARAWLECHARLLAWSGTVWGQCEGQLGWANYHRAAGDLDRARQHAERALTHATEPRQPLALLAAQRTIGELHSAAGHFTAARVHLDAALSLAEACAAPYERAITLLALAELRAAEGETDEANEALGSARAILMPLDARPALARAAALSAALASASASATATVHPAGLSTREVEVLRLIAAGRANREIAAVLCISPNTVLRHVTHILAKTGTENRAAAAVFALRHGLDRPTEERQ